MTKASEKYRNWFESDLLVADLMDQAADDIDERDAEIERLREALEEIKGLQMIYASDLAAIALRPSTKGE